MSQSRKSRAVWGPAFLGWTRAFDHDGKRHARIGNSWRSAAACGVSLPRPNTHGDDAPCRKCLRALDAAGVSKQIPALAVEVQRARR